MGVTETQMKLEEPNLILQDINPDNGFEEVVKIVNKVKKILSYYWKCFG